MKKVPFVLSALFVIFFSAYAQKPAEGDAGYAGADTCKGCHAAYYDSYAKSIHARKAVPGSPANLNACESCHGPGSAHVEKGGKGAGIFAFTKKDDPKDKAAKCLACHEESRHLAFWDNGRHKSAGVSCPDCHNPHSGNEKMLKASQPDLCFGCHKDIRVMVNKQSHHPIREGKMKCTDCHNPHGGFGQKMIKADSINELCYTCHAEKRGPFRFEHPPVVENCLNCHEVHGSNHNKMLVRKTPQLCQSCHDSGEEHHSAEPYTSVHTFRGADPRAEMVGRACLNCHTNIHGSNGFGTRGIEFRR